MTAAVEETGLGQAAGKAATLVRDSVKTVIAASMVGTAIEFYDFYAYGTAAANYFPHIFFSAKDNPTVALLMSLLTFAVAFIARPLGSLIFGHFGDRMGRKTTLAGRRYALEPQTGQVILIRFMRDLLSISDVLE